MFQNNNTNTNNNIILKNQHDQLSRRACTHYYNALRAIVDQVIWRDNGESTMELDHTATHIETQGIGWKCQPP